MIKNANHISTKKGDTGFSRNFSNERIKKTDLLFDVVGNIDELSSFLGLSYHHSSFKDEIKMIQKDLQDIMSIFATNPESELYSKIRLLQDEDVIKLETLEQNIITTCNIQPRFVLPGSDSSLEGAYLDVSRSISRRVERIAYQYQEKSSRGDLGVVMKYLNRLSDVLYIMARSKD